MHPIERGLVKTSQGYVHYLACGTGRPVVLVHMSARSSRMYLDLMHRLGDSARFYSIDLPGFGYSDAVPGPLTMDVLASAVIELCDELGLRDIVVGGTAMGAYVSTEVSARRPDLVAGTVLMSCPFYESPEFASQRHVIARMGYPTDDTGYPYLRTVEQTHEMDMAHAPKDPSRDWVDEVNRDMILSGRRFWDGMPLVAGYPLAERLREIESPVLMIWGKDFLYAKSRDGIVSNVKNGDVQLIPESGIFPYIDNPAEFDRVIREFLERIGSKAGAGKSHSKGH